MVLPESMKRELYREIREYEEERKMEYVTTAERMGKGEGRTLRRAALPGRVPDSA